MVYGFIRQSGGDIGIVSTLGKGTTVRLVLPLQQAAASRLPLLGTVLVVEDDLSDRTTALSLLAPVTDRLLVAEETASALRHLAEPVGLIITDLTLHGQIEGWRLAETALTRWPDARAIVVSGHLPEVQPLSARFPGRIAMLAKPLTQDLLSSALVELFNPRIENATIARHGL